MRSMLFLFSSIAVACVACGGEGGASRSAPVRGMLVDSGIDSATPDAGVDAVAAPDGFVFPRRTVTWRDPFGNYAKTDNLLMDGDFEWSGRFNSSYPWLDLDRGPEIVTGSGCRSGLKCAVLISGGVMLGVGVRPPADQLVTVSLWAYVSPATTCGSVEVSLTGCWVEHTSAAILAKPPEPASDGWCHFSGTVSTANDTPCLFVSMKSRLFGSVLIDDVVMEAAAGTSTRGFRANKSSRYHLERVEALRRFARTEYRRQSKGRSNPSWLGGNKP